MKKLILLLTLFSCIHASARKVYDVIRPGGDFWHNNGSFNTQYGVNPGDTVVLRAGTYGHIDITNISGVTFINEGQVLVDSWNFNNGAINVKILGNGTAGIKYGIRFIGRANFASRCYATGDIEFGWLEVAGNLMGFQVKTDPGVGYPLNYQRVLAHDLYIHDTGQEAIYFGSDNLGGPQINGRIWNVKTERTGRDGIQTRNGTFIIEDCEVISPGLAGDNNHNHGFLIGGNTKNGTIRRCIGRNIPNFGIFCNGYGEILIECNDIQSGNSALFTKNTEYWEDLQKVGYQNFTVRNNIFTSVRSIEMGSNNANIAVRGNVTNNKCSGSVGVAGGITQSNNNAGVTINCTVTVPPVNLAPTANAGTDKTITLPANTTTLNGSGADIDGTIASYTWSKVSGPAGGTIATANAAATNITALQQGTYVFRLTVTDNAGATGTDDVQVIVNAAPAPPANQAPKANAGADKTITLPTNTTTLNGSGTDADGTIATYVWSKVSGPAGGTIGTANAASTNITGLLQGTYVFRLTVTDNAGATGTDDVQIIVNAAPAPPANQAPKANAGADKTITLPATTTTLNGSGTDADGTITTYVWSKVSGPPAGGGAIATANAASTNITGLLQGTYVFRLTVTDNAGATGTDDVQVIVNAAPAPPANQAPKANAGADRDITLPTNALTLTGSGTDADGTIASYAWNKVSGPAGGNIGNSALASTNITGLLQGTYVFRLTVTDNAGATGTDDVQVIVNAAVAAANQAPLAEAGNEQNITLPANSTILDGSASKDPDGQITSWSWIKIAGPATGAIQNANTAKPAVSNLERGSYEFELTVTDNKGATSKDRVKINVLKINQKPVARVKDTIVVTLPVQSAELDGSQSYDPDGKINAYSWKLVNGPVASAPRILSQTQSKTVVADLTAGNYQFELTVEDDEKAQTKVNVVVIVKNSSSRRLVPVLGVYPNPVMTNTVNVNIETDAVGRTNITIYDLNGKPVVSEQFVKNSTSFRKAIDVAGLPKGTFMIVVQVDVQEKVVKKLVKL